MSLEVLEQLAAEEEFKLRDRFSIGYCNGLKSAVIAVRLGESLDELMESPNIFGEPRDRRDAYDVGFIAAVRKAKALVGRSLQS